MACIYHYCSVYEALADLKEKGYTYDFNIHDEEIKQNPDNFEIEHIYRYEGESNPADEAAVYGIKSIEGLRGVFVTGFSANSQSDTAQILIDITIQGR
ncbi:hypothetical protein RCH18_002337 [Flavobacterium sp. PL11]|jgi:hypothetical protein|uniref:hypothetical protein n=1 Tax=Flavobacterium sp. PL11 TaxID=3071717 RepID=UPI002DF7745E|nr:hypothetical protein [Flavobacterium sp. PL11]